MTTATIHTAKPPGWTKPQNPRIDLLAPFGDQLKQFTREQLIWLISKGQRKLRFSGLTDKIWTVNHHALLCAYIEPNALWHDAAEAFFGDVVTPLKSHFQARNSIVVNTLSFKELESKAQKEIERYMGINPHSNTVTIKKADQESLKVESFCLDMGIFEHTETSVSYIDMFDRLIELDTEQAASKWFETAFEVING